MPASDWLLPFIGGQRVSLIERKADVRRALKRPFARAVLLSISRVGSRMTNKLKTLAWAKIHD
jgi:hypothetical protein